MDSSPRQLLPSVIHHLRNPAGRDSKFASLSSINANKLEFLSRCHATFGELQMISIKEILRIEEAIKESGSDKRLKKNLEYQRLLWRRIPDAIAWLLVEGDRHIIKRMCGFQKRLFLKECNPNAAIEFISEFNRDKLQFALWADATNCIDAGDILIKDVRRSGVTLAELKEGIVNNKAFAALKCEFARNKFIDEYGESGQKQLDRIVRQEKKLDDIISLIDTDKGVDPFTKEYVTLYDISTPDEDYAESLCSVISSAKINGMSIVNVDSCLWIAAVTQDKITLPDIIEAIEAEAFAGPHAESSKEILNDLFGRTHPYPIHDIRESFCYEIVYPLYLANISTEHIIDIVFGKVRVFMYFDWDCFRRLADKLDIHFEWSTKKYGRRMKACPESQRPLILGDRVPRIKMGDVTISLGATQMQKILFDLIRPEIILRQKSEPNLIQHINQGL